MPAMKAWQCVQRSRTCKSRFARLPNCRSRSGRSRTSTTANGKCQGSVEGARAPLFHKRIEYRGEDELRALLPGPPFNEGKIHLDPDVAKQGGRYVPVNLEILVKEVRVPPHAAPWFAQAVRSVVERSPVRARVTPSAIELPPHETDGGETGQP